MLLSPTKPFVRASLKRYVCFALLQRCFSFVSASQPSSRLRWARQVKSGVSHVCHQHGLEAVVGLPSTEAELPVVCPSGPCLAMAPKRRSDWLKRQKQ